MCDTCGYPGDNHFVLGCAYPAAAVDGHGEYMAADELRKTAWQYLAKGRQVGFYHADGTTGRGSVVESYIYRGPDWETVAADGTTQVIKSGDWLLGVVFDAATWPLIRTGRVTGWSIQGIARRRRPAEPAGANP